MWGRGGEGGERRRGETQELFISAHFLFFTRCRHGKADYEDVSNFYRVQDYLLEIQTVRTFQVLRFVFQLGRL